MMTKRRRVLLTAVGVAVALALATVRAEPADEQREVSARERAANWIWNHDKEVFDAVFPDGQTDYPYEYLDAGIRTRTTVQIGGFENRTWARIDSMSDGRYVAEMRILSGTDLVDRLIDRRMIDARIGVKELSTLVWEETTTLGPCDCDQLASEMEWLKGESVNVVPPRTQVLHGSDYQVWVEHYSGNLVHIRVSGPGEMGTASSRRTANVVARLAKAVRERCFTVQGECRSPRMDGTSVPVYETTESKQP